MSLSSALDTAKSSLAASQTQTAIISRNIANVNTAGATRKYANVITGASGRVQVTSVTQSSNSVLYRNMLDANAAVGKGNVIGNGLDRVNDLLGDTELSRSPASMVASLGDALSTLAASPNNYELARNAATAAADLVTTLNDASDTVQTIRKDADNELVVAAADMTRILARIEDLNRSIIAGTRSGADITDLGDQRDQAVVALSQYVGVTSQTRGDNDLVLYTDSGVTLFETKARTVQYSATPGLNATVPQGNAFRIDGTPVTGDLAYMPLKSGSVAGLVALRDDVMVTYETQLDEIARGLIQAFKETSATGAASTGVFTAAGLSAPAEASIGTFKAGSATSADTLGFDFIYNDQTYRASLSFTGPATASAYQAALQSAVQNAIPVGGTAPLGAGKVAVENNGGAFSLSTESTGVLGLGLSNIRSTLVSKYGGLATAAAPVPGTAGPPATPATMAIGAFAAGTITAGDKLAFQFTYDGVAYAASRTFTGTPADAGAFTTFLQGAIETAVPVAGGVPLGAGKVTAVNTAGALGLATVATGAAKSIALTGVGAVAGDPSLFTGGLVAGASASPITGLAGQLRLAAAVAADPRTIRDGVVYKYNAEAAGGYTVRLNELSDALAARRGFAAGSGADPSGSVADYAASSVSWLQNARQTSLSETEYKTTLLDGTKKALSDETGINMDEQWTHLSEIQRSYQASAKLITTIDEMLKTLLDSI